MDLEKAVKALRENEETRYYIFENVTPCFDGGIVFKTTHHTYVKWFPSGEIKENKKDDWRK